MTTAGRPVGMAEIANAIAAVKTVSKLSPRDRLSAIEMPTAPPGDDQDLGRQLLQLDRERGVLILGRLEHVRDVPDLGRHPGRRDEERPGAAGDVRVHVDHVRPVAERRVGGVDRVDALGDRQALAGQRRLGDLERCRGEQAAVGGDDVARLHRDDVPGHELLGRELEQLAVAVDARLDDHHLLERGHGLGGLPLLRRPSTALNSVRKSSTSPVPSSLSG